MNVSNQSVGVDQMNESIPRNSGDLPQAPSDSPSSPGEKIVVDCPNCRAVLRVRRVYIGSQVRCKSCNHDFTVAAPPNLLRRPAEEVTSINAESPTRQSETEREIRRLKEEINRVSTERTELCDERDRLTTELNEIRATLGGVAPAQVRPLAEERDSLREERDLLRAQVLRFEVENRDLRADQSAHAAIAAEREAILEELMTARRDLALLGSKLEDRDRDLESSRTLHTRLKYEHQSVIDESKSLKTALAERDQAIADHAEQHRKLRESHVLELDNIQQFHRQALEPLEAELAALRERHNRLQEQHRSNDELRTQLQDQVWELEKAQERVKVEFQALIEAERTTQMELTEQLLEQTAKANEAARTAEESIRAHTVPAVTPPAATAELKAALAQVADLKEWLTESERLNRDMAALLENIGIVYTPPVRR